MEHPAVILYNLYELYKDEVTYYDGHLFKEHFQERYQVRQRCVIEEDAVVGKQYIDSSFFSPFDFAPPTSTSIDF